MQWNPFHEECSKTYKRPWIAWPVIGICIVVTIPIFLLFLVAVLPLLIICWLEKIAPEWMKKDVRIFDWLHDYIFEERKGKETITTESNEGGAR